MLEDFLQDIYEKALSLEMMKEASFYASIRHIYNRLDYWNEATLSLEKIIYDLKETDMEKAVELMESSLNVQKCYGDIHKYIATIDSEVIPKVSDYLKRFKGINVSDGEWTLESSDTGFLTVKNDANKYLHSPSDPMWEGFLYAYSIFDPAAKAYYILGGGLGYLAYQLWRMSKKEADIYVFEINKKMSEYSFLYGVMSLIDEDKLHYITGDDTDIILEKYAEDIPNTKLKRTINYWDLKKYNGPYADFFRIELSNEVTHRAYEHKWRSNYDGNMMLDHLYFSDLDKNSFKNEWLVVGAGPSLNDNIDFIKESIGKRTICAVNSSLKWFYKHNIKPDLCTACDPDDLLVPHIEGYEQFSEDIPLVADCVTNHNYMMLYKGPKYFIHSTATLLTVGKENIKEPGWSIGGTVTSLALGVAQQMEAKKVYLIGVDLGYPQGEMFADNVGHNVEKWNSDEEFTVSVDDKIIPTSVIFREYRCMMEDQIYSSPNVEIINKSLHGAYIKGTFCNKWWECLPDTDNIEDYILLLENLKKESNILKWQEKYFIFWQIISRMRSKIDSICDDDYNEINDAYESIYNEFKIELDWNQAFDSKVMVGRTYIFTAEFLGERDIDSRRALKVAKNELKKHRSVLVVNSGEKMGGNRVAMHDIWESKYNGDLEKTENVLYENMTIPYFQFPKGMPDTNYYKVFLESFTKGRPEKIIINDKYSLLADFCQECLKIPVETCE